MKVYLFTKKYPFGLGEQFVTGELSYLSRKIDKIIIVPFSNIKGSQRALPDGVELMLIKNNIYRKIIALFKPKNILKNIEYMNINSIHNLYEFKYFMNGLVFFHRLRNTVNKTDILYTYWLMDTTFTACLLKNESDCKVMSRTHRRDLYEEHLSSGYYPFRKYVLNTLDIILTISDEGKKYLENKYKLNNIVINRLGVNIGIDHPINRSKNIITLVSCSSIIQLKRVDLILKSVLKYSESYPEEQILWIHFGDGSRNGLRDLREMCSKLPHNLEIDLRGFVSNEHIINFYKTNFIDLFINLSIVEGIPFTIMEAMSFGIPVIAPDIGAISEIVIDGFNGKLINDVNPIVVSGAIKKCIRDYNDIKSRNKIINYIKLKYNSTTNQELLYKIVCKLGESNGNR